MAITSWGYDGPITEAPWALLSMLQGPSIFTVGNSSGDFRPTAVVGSDRTVSIAGGNAAAYGVLCVSDGAVQKQLGPIASGTRWDMIVLRYDWTTNTTSIEVVPGSSSDVTAFNVRENTRGVKVDQPIALVQVAAGSTAPTQIIDLRVWGFNGGIIAAHDYARRYLDQIGTQVRIDDLVWQQVLSPSGTLTWRLDDQKPAARSWAQVENDLSNPRAWGQNSDGTMAGRTIANAPAGLYLLSGWCDISLPSGATAPAAAVWRFLANGNIAGGVSAESRFDAQPGRWQPITAAATPHFHPGGTLTASLQVRSVSAMRVRYATFYATYVGPSAG